MGDESIGVVLGRRDVLCQCRWIEEVNTISAVLAKIVLLV